MLTRELPLVIVDGSFHCGTEYFTVLFFPNAATVELDAILLEGKPQARNIRKASISADRGSCGLA